jgi:SHS2 domain-containing protein
VTSGIRVRAATVPEAFARAALAIAARAFDPEAVEERDIREVRAHGESVEALFTNWINECLYVHDVEGFAWRRIEFAVFDVEPRASAEPMRLHSMLHGEALDAGQSAPQAIPSIARAAVAIASDTDGFELTVAV